LAPFVFSPTLVLEPAAFDGEIEAGLVFRGQDAANISEPFAPR
jgi:hypothetical protein